MTGDVGVPTPQAAEPFVVQRGWSAGAASIERQVSAKRTLVEL